MQLHVKIFCSKSISSSIEKVEIIMIDALLISTSVFWRADISSLWHCSSCATASSASRVDQRTCDTKSTPEGTYFTCYTTLCTVSYIIRISNCFWCLILLITGLYCKASTVALLLELGFLWLSLCLKILATSIWVIAMHMQHCYSKSTNKNRICKVLRDEI